MKKLILIISIIPTMCFSQWSQIGNDIDGSNGDLTGFSVSLNSEGNIIAIGSPRITTDVQGFVQVFENNSGVWTQIGNTINSSGSSNGLGYSIDINAIGNIVAIGGTNLVKIFEFNSGVWSQIGSDIIGENSGEELGFSISLNNDGNIVAIGSPQSNINGSRSGKVSVFENLAGVWTQIGTDISGEVVQNRAGWSVSLNGIGNIVAVGAPLNQEAGTLAGQVRVFENSGNQWIQLGNDIFGEEYNQSGETVSLNDSGNIIAIASPISNNNGSTSGAVRVYENNSGVWSQIGNEMNGDFGDLIGKAMSINSAGDIVSFGSNSGFVRVFQYSSNLWNQVESDIIQESSNDGAGAFRHTVSLNSTGNLVAIGAPNNGNVGSGSGHVRIFGESSILNVDEKSLGNNFNLYQHPNETYYTLDLGNIYDNIRIQLFDVCGKKIFLKDYYNINEILLETKGLSNGIYFLNIQSFNEQTILKFIVKN